MATGKGYKNGVGVKMTKDALPEFEATLMKLLDVEVLVGFPEDTAARPIDPENPEGDITNPQIAYLQDNGRPEQNLPARPFMIPGVESAKDDIAQGMGQIMRAALKGADQGVIEKGFHRVGFAAKIGIQREIQSGVPPPLSERTLRARLKRGRKGAAQELDRRWDGQAPSTEYAKPLVDTAEMLKAANYAIRSRKKRSK